MAFDTKAIDNDALHNAQEDTPSNRSGNRPFAEVLAERPSRRGIMTGTLAVAATGFLAQDAQAYGWNRRRYGRGLVGFTPVSIDRAVSDQRLPQVASEYSYQVIIPWGTPIEPGATVEYAGEPDRRPTSEEAALQVGIGHDGMWFFPNDRYARGNGFGWDASDYADNRFGRRHRRGRSSSSGMLCVNHEFGRTSHVLGKDAPESLEDVRVMQHVHGVSVVALERYGTRWEVVKSPNARRIHVNTPVAFSGPVESSPLLENPAGNVPLGTVNNCGSGPTPWGTYLTCEENFNGYFGASDGLPLPTEEQERYGFSANGFGYDWWRFDKRFDLADPDFANERFRFGWIVEIDPMDGTQTPVKRTAMGRFKHEAVAIAESRSGRVAAYMGDDQRFDYCYRYVSDKAWRDAIAAGESPLDEGVLYVARFDSDGTGEWLELSMDVPELAARFTGMDELLVNTRLAADIVGATPMDRPEWTTIGRDGEIFWTLTNNTRREESDAANPQAPNPDGHIIRMVDGDDHLGTRFSWDIFILASETRGTPGVFTDPDAAYADEDGRLFIGTDGGQPDDLTNQLVVFDTTADDPLPQRLLTGVLGDEITGWTTTPDRRWGFTNSQHPGNGDPSLTNFPAQPDGVTIPRDATIIINHRAFRVVGS